MPSNLELSLHFFVQVAVILSTCWGVGVLLRRIGQPQVVADMVAGFVVGPTLLGLAFPAVQGWLFPTTLAVGPAGAQSDITHPSVVVLYVLGQLGLVLYMFVVGLGFDGGMLRTHLRSAVGSSIAGIVAPLLVGAGLGLALVGNPVFFDAAVAPWQAALFVAAAMAITAFPMLARIIHENGLSSTPAGTVALACAAVDDTVAWVLLALVIATAQGDPTIALLAVVGGLVYVVVVLTVGRRLFGRLADWATGPDGVRAPGFTVALVILLLCAAFTEAVGVYAVVGAFLCGVAMPREGRFVTELRALIEPLTVRLLLPLFFVFAGLNAQFELLLDPTVLLVFVVVLAAAFLTKLVACTLGARLAGLDWGSAASVGTLMNARGLMELILLNIGLEAGLVTPALYTVLALMTVLTTFAATPLHRFVRRRWVSTERPARADRA